MNRLLMVMSLLAGCASSARPSAREPVVARETPTLEVTAPEAETAARALAQHVDPALGLVVVLDVADGEGDEPRPRRAALDCAADVTALADQLAAYLASRPPESEAPGWSCRGSDCELPGMMEYDPNRILRFGRGTDGQTVVRGYFAIDALAVDPEHLAETRAEADRDFDALSQRRCP